jgi:ATP-binding cassette subfamily B multidrug efflux pump
MEEEIPGRAYDARLMRRLLTYLRPYRRAIAVSLVLLGAQALIQVAGPLLTRLAIDRYLTPAGPRAASLLDPWLAASVRTGLLQIAALYLALIVTGFLCDFSQTFLMQRTGQLAMFDLRREIIAHLQRLDVAYFDRNPIGRLITRVTTDVDALNDMWTSGLLAVLGDFMALSFVLIAMLRLSPKLTVLAMAVIPLVFLATMRFRTVVQEGYRRIRVAVAAINAYLQEHASGMAVVQLFNRQERSRNNFERMNREYRDAFQDTVNAYGWFYPLVEFLSMLAMAMLVAYGGWRITGGTLSLGILAAFLQYGLRFFRPIQDLSEKYNILQSAMAASERVFKLLDTPVAIQSPARPRAFPETAGAVEFDHVWFAYQDEDWVLRDVSFRIEPGDTLAVVGHTGAGKTTLVNLLLRFYDVQRGAIRIGGIDVREFALEDLRRHFGLVLQDPYLFTGTIASNILMQDELSGEAERRLISAAEHVNLDDFVRSLPMGFAHPVEERGSGFSTGQKQLLTFARALARDPKFLILDEATSSVDTETELRIRQALERLIRGRTSLIIAHRLSTIQRATRILVMHKGRVRESGTHRELLALRGLYWKLYELQYKDQEAAVWRT